MAYEPALFIHLLSVIGFFSGVVVATVGAWRAPRGRTAGEIAAVAGVSRIGALVAAIAWVLVIVTGLNLVAASDHEYEEGWIVASLGLVVLAGILGGAGGGQAKRARQRAEAGDANLDEVRALFADRRSLVLNVLATVLALVVLALMVWQPGS